MACKIDWLPAIFGIGLGMVITFGIMNIRIVPTFS